MDWETGLGGNDENTLCICRNAMKASRSSFEQLVGDSLKHHLQGFNVAVEYETEKIPYVISHSYIPDYILVGPKKKFYIEVKGWFPGIDRRKFLAVIQQNPDMDIRILFQKPKTRISKYSDMTYAEWSTKHKLIWGSFEDLQRWIREIIHV